MGGFHDEEWVSARLAETTEERVAFDKAEAARWLDDRAAGKYAAAHVPVTYLHNAVREIAWLCHVIDGAWATIDRLHERDREAAAARRPLLVRNADGTIWVQVQESEADDD